MADATDGADAVDGVPEIDRLGRDILRTVSREGGEATTSDVKAATRAANHRILYRVREHLRPLGLVTAEQPTTQGGRVPPKIIRLTEAGEDVAASLSPGGLAGGGDGDGDGDGDAGADENRAVEARLDRLEAEVEWLAGQTEDLAEREFDLLRAGMLGLRDYLVEETDADPDTIAGYVDRHERSGGSGER